MVLLDCQSGMINKPKYSSPYEPVGRISLRMAMPLSLQHVPAMFAGNLSPLLIVNES